MLSLASTKAGENPVLWQPFYLERNPSFYPPLSHIDTAEFPYHIHNHEKRHARSHLLVIYHHTQHIFITLPSIFIFSSGFFCTLYITSPFFDDDTRTRTHATTSKERNGLGIIHPAFVLEMERDMDGRLRALYPS